MSERASERASESKGERALGGGYLRHRSVAEEFHEADRLSVVDIYRLMRAHLQCVCVCVCVCVCERGREGGREGEVQGNMRNDNDKTTRRCS